MTEPTTTQPPNTQPTFPGLGRAIIWDLDNCLSDDEPRVPLINWSLEGEARWDAYHEAAAQDRAAHVQLFHARLAEENAFPIFITARPEWARRVTKIFLGRAGFAKPGHLLLMRANGDKRSSPEIKADKVDWLLANYPGLKLVEAYDDREDCLEVYRARGIPAKRLAIHEHETHVPPTKAPPLPPDIAALGELRPQKDANHAAKAESPDAGDLLRAAAQTFSERNATYGAAYKSFGAVLASLFPAGVSASGPEELGRLAVIVMLAGKLHRYTQNFPRGHQDSAHDASVYAAMLEELTQRGA